VVGSSLVYAFPATAKSQPKPEAILKETGIWDLAVDNEGDLYITFRSLNGSLLKLPRGSERPEILLSGLNIPYGVAVDSEGAVYFVEFGNPGASNGTLKMLPKGQAEPVTLLEGLTNPYDVAVDSAGRIYFTEKFGTLKVLEPGEEVPRLLLSDLGRVYGIALDPEGNLLLVAFGSPVVEDGGALLKLDTSGTGELETLLEGLSHPVGLAVDAKGNIYFSEYAQEGGLKKYSIDGNVTALLSSLTSAAGVAVGVKGDVYVVESAEGTLWRIKSEAGGLWWGWALAALVLSVSVVSSAFLLKKRRPQSGKVRGKRR